MHTENRGKCSSRQPNRHLANNVTFSSNMFPLPWNSEARVRVVEVTNVITTLLNNSTLTAVDMESIESADKLPNCFWCFCHSCIDC